MGGKIDCLRKGKCLIGLENGIFRRIEKSGVLIGFICLWEKEITIK